MSLDFLKNHPAARLPTRGSPASAGLDLYAAEAMAIPVGERRVVSTGLTVMIPPGCYGRVAPRSGLSVKKGIDVAAGVVDSDYRGTVGIVLVNNGPRPFQVDIGDRVAQLIVEKIELLEPRFTETVHASERGDGGFGSTGQ